MISTPAVTPMGAPAGYTIGTVLTNDKTHNFEISHSGATDFRPTLGTPNFKFDAEL